MRVLLTTQCTSRMKHNSSLSQKMHNPCHGQPRHEQDITRCICNRSRLPSPISPALPGRPFLPPFPPSHPVLVPSKFFHRPSLPAVVSSDPPLFLRLLAQSIMPCIPLFLFLSLLSLCYFSYPCDEGVDGGLQGSGRPIQAVQLPLKLQVAGPQRALQHPHLEGQRLVLLPFVFQPPAARPTPCPQPPCCLMLFLHLMPPHDLQCCPQVQPCPSSYFFVLKFC